MKLLHLLARANRAGVEKNCFHFIATTPQFQHEVIIMNGDGPMTDAWKSQGANVHTLNILHHNPVTFYRKLRSKLPPDNFEKIIVWTNTRMPVVMRALNKYQGADIYVHMGNPVPPGGLKESLISAFFPPDNKIHLRAVSEYVQRSLANNSYYRRFRNKVCLKAIMIPEVLGPEPSEITSQSRVNFGMVARLDPIKDHKTVILAFKLLLQEYPKAILHLVGGGPLLKPLADFAEQHGVGKSVVFHGDTADVHAIMKDWDLFLFATTPSEGIAGTVAEALSMGLPVVATDLPMIHQWDKEGRYISFCNPGDPENMYLSVKKLLNDTNQRKKIHAEAPGYIRDRFSPEIFSYNYMSNH